MHVPILRQIGAGRGQRSSAALVRYLRHGAVARRVSGLRVTLIVRQECARFFSVPGGDRIVVQFIIDGPARDDGQVNKNQYAEKDP